VIGVPVIDVGDLDSDAQRAIDEACREWGFFQIVGHGIGAQLRAALLAEMHGFFALPDERKRGVERTASNAWGYYDRELTKNVRDWKQIFDVGPAEDRGPLAGSTPQWPEDLPGFRETLEAFSGGCGRVAGRLLEAICINLGRPADALSGAFGADHTSFLRLNYYPTCPDPARPDAPTTPEHGHFGIHHHTDAGALTVLLQDEQAGLQVLRGGLWHTVEPREDALVMNIGDVVQVWSNDAYTAPLHRVIASAAHARYSAAYFFNPSYATDYAPLSGTPRYRPINWGEFRAGRAAGDYADLGEEIQISHYRIRDTAERT
jgi:isopenicillin N synthase-like dioxygenase